jgi:hypothetical protein
MLSKHRGEGRVVVGKGAGQRGGQAAIMMCGCDGGWNGGDGFLKSVFEWIRAMNHGFQPIFYRKFRLPVTKDMEGGSDHGALPWAGRHDLCRPC